MCKQLALVARRLVVVSGQFEHLGRPHGNPNIPSLQQGSGSDDDLVVIAVRVETVQPHRTQGEVTKPEEGFDNNSFVGSVGTKPDNYFAVVRLERYVA